MNINRLKLVTLGMLAVGAITLWANCVKADTLLYSDGPINGTLDAGGISQGRGPLSDSFTVGGNSAMTVAVVGLWLSPGDTPVAVDWEIGTTPFGSDIASGTSSFFDQTNMGPNAGNFDIWQSSLDIGGTVLAGTTYWFSLSNATTDPAFSGEDFVYWDLNNGPSSAFQLANGVNHPVGAQPFDIFGNVITTSPEPGSILLLGSGLLSLAGIRRRRVRA